MNSAPPIHFGAVQEREKTAFVQWPCLCGSFPGSAHALGCYVSLALPGHSCPAGILLQILAALGSAALVTEVKEALLCPEECGGKLLCPS